MGHAARLPFFQLAQTSLHAMINLSGTVKKISYVTVRVGRLAASTCHLFMHAPRPTGWGQVRRT